MDESEALESPLETVADVIGAKASETFAVLGNETRLAILLALWRGYGVTADQEWDAMARDVVSFTTLRERVGFKHGEQFNYHLEQLLGTFVEKSEDGYELLPAGDKIVYRIIASIGFGEEFLPHTEVDFPCTVCESPTAITYQRQRLYHVCTACDGIFSVGDEHPDGVLGAWIANPTVMRDRSPESIFTAVRTEVFHLFAMRAAGVCTECSGRLEHTLHVCESHTTKEASICPNCDRQFVSVARFDCAVCKHSATIALQSLALRHPAVIAFYYRHGVELGYDPIATTKLLANATEVSDAELISTDPTLVRITCHHEGDAVQLTYDEDMNVVDVSDSK